MTSKKTTKVHKMPPREKGGFRTKKKLNRVERLELAVKRLSSMPQFLLKSFQELTKVVQDLRFTYEVLGKILQDKGIITQEEVTEMGNKLIEQQRKENEEKIKLAKDEADAKSKTDESREKLEGEIPCEIKETLSEEEVKKELSGDTDNSLREDVSKKLMVSRKDLQKEQIQSIDVSIKDKDIDNAK